MFLTLAVDRGEWSASHPSHFTPEGKSSQYPLYRKLGGALSSSGQDGKEKNSQFLPGIEPWTSIP